MQKGDFLPTILKAPQSVFSNKELLLLWGNTDINAAKVRIHYYAKHNKLYRIRRGFYAKNKHYNKFELATKMYTPAYISFETVLAQAGIIFQHYNQIFIASYLAREVIADTQLFHYKKIKTSILTNFTGLNKNNNYFIASPERALLDTLYIYKDYYFDNLTPINWEKTFAILPIYHGNKRMAKKINNLYKNNRT